MPTNYSMWYRTVSVPLFSICLFIKLKYTEETDICIALLVLKIDSWHFAVESTKTKRTSDTVWCFSEVSILATSKHTTHTAQWKMMFELASVEIANCLALSSFKIGNKNSQDLKKSPNGPSSYYPTAAVNRLSYKVMEVTPDPFKVKVVNQNANYYSMTKCFKSKSMLFRLCVFMSSNESLNLCHFRRKVFLLNIQCYKQACSLFFLNNHSSRLKT